ncbi:MAG TPA: hypothetical protein VFS00_03115, partial [Polyangiaceae bacterium]|nr:hypothetical protein [Polyangiaceae bacterium]
MPGPPAATPPAPATPVAAAPAGAPAPGRRTRVRGAALGLAGALATVGLMARRGEPQPAAFWAGLVALVVAIAGALAAAGAFDGGDEDVVARARLSALAPALAALVALAAAFALALAGAAAGYVPNAWAAPLLPALLLGALAQLPRLAGAF